MKKRLIPATIAALAISLTSVVAPSAYAGKLDEHIVSGTSTDITADGFATVAELTDLADFDAEDLSEVEFFNADGTPATWLTYTDGKLSVAAGTEAGEYTLEVAATTVSGNTTRDFEGELTITVDGTEVDSIEAETELSLNSISQSTGLRLVNKTASTTVTVTDEDGTELATGLSNDDFIYVLANAGIDGPIKVTVDDPSMAKAFESTITIEGHAPDRDDNDSDVILDGTAGTVEPSVNFQDTGITIENHSEATEITAIDEDEQNLETRVTDDGDIQVRPGTDVDGPITLTVTDPSLGDDEGEYTITVNGHEEDRDDNESDVLELTIGGTAGDVIANGTKQDTGLTVSNASGAVEADTNQDDITAAVEDGKIFVTPEEDSEGPVTITVTDEDGNDDAETITVKAPESDEGSSIDGSSGGAIGIAIAAVVAAIAAFLGGVATGIIQLPPAIANLLPF